MEIEAPPLSFTVPPKHKGFAVHFPFIVISTDQKASADGTPHRNLLNNLSKSPASSSRNFGVIGLRIACFNRNISIPFDKNPPDGDKNTTDNKFEQMQVPYAASVYQQSHPKNVSSELFVRLETVPPQPNLLVSFSISPTPLEDATMVPVHLSDGEIYTIPPFRLENDFGPSGLGKMERLQIVGVGLPGLQDEILFDTDELAKALEEEEDSFSEHSTNAFEELMESDDLPPLKMKCLAEGLSLKSINDKNKFFGEGSRVTFQIAATHDMGNQLVNGGNVRIRFRYRGPSPCPGIEIWRKREITLHIIRVKGPRLSSLTLRSDLSWGSAYTDLCRSLIHQESQLEEYGNFESNIDLKTSSVMLNNEAIDQPVNSVLHRVGMDQGVFVSSNDIILLMAVANETNSTMILSNSIGMVGGFESSPMPTVRVTSGVSVKIPVVIPRIDCVDENGELVDIASELIARTALQWETEVGEAEDSFNKRVRQGRVRIPSKCLREIIEEQKSFATRVCKPPVVIKVFVGDREKIEGITINPGCPLDTVVEAKIQDVPSAVLENWILTLEFCCARKDSGCDALTFEEQNDRAYFWCGTIRKSVKVEHTMNHRARICFLKPGEFVVSACVKLCSKTSFMEEKWWAPQAKSVIVKRIED